MRERDGLAMLTWPLLDDAGVDACVTTRSVGNLALHVGDDEERVIRNRVRLAAALGAGAEDLVFCDQVHRPAVTVVTREHGGRGVTGRTDAIAATDALVTTEPGLMLVVLVADCVPLVLFDPVSNVLAAVHAGWAGTVQGVTTAAVRTMAGLGAVPARIVAGIGPSIAPARYQVGSDVRDRADAAFGRRASEVVTPDGTGRWRFDLWRANEIQLEEAGVPGDRIERAGLDTGPGTPFYSHRSEAPTGRFAAVARIRP
jgi:purine-nucleoside/S-methyl-5'-thioadenosine phosphorylase / adenosine deaminase